MLWRHMTRLAALLCAALVLLPLSAAATYVSANAVVVEGQPATLDLWNECPPILCAPTHPLMAYSLTAGPITIRSS